jgi:hypothetical protein
MKILNILFAVFVLFLLGGCDKKASGLVLDVRSVINKTPSQVADVLGEPDTTYVERILGKQIFCQRYRTHNIEIQYPEELSTDIVIYGPHDLPFTQEALKAFSLPHSKYHPKQFERDALLRWYDFDEFQTISFYNVEKDSAGKIRNFSVFFKTKGLVKEL